MARPALELYDKYEIVIAQQRCQPVANIARLRVRVDHEGLVVKVAHVVRRDVCEQNGLDLAA